MHGWVPILIMIGLGAGFGIVNVLVPRLLGPKKPTPEKLAPYECGMPPVGDARERHPVKFYLVAMIFLLFDIEVAFLYPFAMAIRSLGWFGFFQILVFFAIDALNNAPETFAAIVAIALLSVALDFIWKRSRPAQPISEDAGVHRVASASW